MRWTLALTLALAIVGGPLSLDACGATCAGSRTVAVAAAASAHTADPICQRATTRIARIDGVPAPCGHDHTGIERGAVGDVPLVRAVTVPVIAVITASRVVAPFQALEARVRHSVSPPGAVAHALASPLRI